MSCVIIFGTDFLKFTSCVKRMIISFDFLELIFIQFIDVQSAALSIVVWIELRGCLHVELQGVDGFFTIVVLMAPVVCHSVQAYVASVMSEHQ